MQFGFKVTDANGLWGSMWIEADTANDAETAIRQTLTHEEVEPNGSLLPEFDLEPALTLED